MSRILLLDDSMTIIKVVKLTFASIPGCEVDISKTEEDARKKIANKGFDAVICYAGFSGEQTVNFLLDVQKYTTNIVILTESNGTIAEFENIGIKHFVKKPFNSDELRTLVIEMIEAQRAPSDSDAEPSHEFGEYSNEPTRSMPKKAVPLSEVTNVKPPPPPSSSTLRSSEPIKPVAAPPPKPPAPSIPQSVSPPAQPVTASEQVKGAAGQAQASLLGTTPVKKEPSHENQKATSPALTLDLLELQRTVRETQDRKTIVSSSLAESRALPVKKISMVSKSAQQATSQNATGEGISAASPAPAALSTSQELGKPEGLLGERTMIASSPAETVLFDSAAANSFSSTEQKNALFAASSSTAQGQQEEHKLPAQTFAVQETMTKEIVADSSLLQKQIVALIEKDVEKMRATVEMQLRGQLTESFKTESLARIAQLVRPILQDEVRKWLASAGVELTKSIVKEEIAKLVAD